MTRTLLYQFQHTYYKTAFINCSASAIRRHQWRKPSPFKSKNRKKNKRDSSSEAALSIAAENLSQSNHHRLCQGPRISLEHPLIDRKKEISYKESMNTVETKVGSLWNGCLSDNAACSGSRKQEIMKPESLENGMPELVRSVGIVGPEIAIDLGKPTWRIIKWDGSNGSWEELDADSDEGCPSKFLMTCLNSVQNALQQDEAFSADDGRPFFANSWGFDFWSCYNNGNDVLDTDGAHSKIEKIAWITSTATDSISMKEKEGVSLDYPFLLYLVPSQDKACKVLKVCKPLEALGVCTLFLHSGVSIDLQIQSLKSCEPEFIISTPERLLELLLLKAVDISDVSLMVIDGLEASFGGPYLDAVKSMRQFISGNNQTVIFCDCMNTSSDSVCSKAAGGLNC